MIPLISAAFEFVIQCFKREKILLLYQARRLAVRAWRFGQSRFTIDLQRSGLQWNEGCHGKRGILVFSEWVRCICVQWVSEVSTCVQWVSEVYMCPVSKWDVHVSSEWVRCTCAQWVSEMYMCPVSEWDVHVSSEWVRCTCVQRVSEVYMCPVSEWGVHVPSEWVRCTCVQWVSEMYMCPVSEWGVHVSSKWVSEWFEKDWMVSLSVWVKQGQDWQND